MYKIYRIEQKQVREIKKPEKDCWIDISDPTPEDISALKKYIDITEEVLVSVEDAEEVPKLEKLDDYNFLVLQTPVLKEEELRTYKTTPLGILFSNEYLVTVHFGKNDVMDYLERKLQNIAKNDLVSTRRKAQFILKVMLFTSKFYLNYLKRLTTSVNLTQQKFESDPHNKDILGLMEYGKALSYFNGYLQANHLVYQKITKKPQFMSDPDDADLCEDIMDENLQALEAVKIHGKILQSTISTFNNLISNKLNENVKILTAFSIILMMPTLVASIYGMNLHLPFQDHQLAFVIVMAMAIVLTAAMGAFFLRKKLF
jgi:magnesium transporter